MRVVKEAAERKNEILDIAQRLFHQKGYSQTTIEDILKESGIAKGTLYYHFKSKEDILLAMIERQISQREKAMHEIAENEKYSAVEKLFRVVRLLSHSGILADGLHEKENSELHHKSFIHSIMSFTPIMTEIVEQGIKSGEFSTPYPRESVELLFCASAIHDPGNFSWSEDVRRRKNEAFFWMLEITLGISPEAKKQLYKLANISIKQEKDENE